MMMMMTTMSCNVGVWLQVELQRAVQECSETEGGAEEDTGGGGASGTDSVHQRLVSILARLLQEGGASADGGASREPGSQAHTSLNF